MRQFEQAYDGLGRPKTAWDWLGRSGAHEDIQRTMSNPTAHQPHPINSKWYRNTQRTRRRPTDNACGKGETKLEVETQFSKVCDWLGVQANCTPSMYPDPKTHTIVDLWETC